MSYSSHDDERGNQAGVRSKAIWMRGLAALLFVFAFGLGQSILFVLAVIQFIWMLVKNERNQFLADFGGSLAQWLSEVARFLIAYSEEKPFPWKAWPTA